MKVIKNNFKKISWIFLVVFMMLNANSYTETKEISKLIPFEKNGQWGFVNKDGMEIVKPIYLEVREFKEGLAVIKEFKEKTLSFKYGIINEKGNKIIISKYDYISDFSEERAIILENNKYGAIDKSGKVIIKPLYDKLEDFKETFTVFKIKDKYGYINKNGKIVIKPVYDEAYSFLKGIAKVKMNGLIKYIDINGNIISSDNPETKDKLAIIDDLAKLTQDATVYLDKNKKSQSYMTEEYSKVSDNYYNKMYFMPWHKNVSFDKKSFRSILASYEKNHGYGENKLPHSDKWIKDLVENADEQNFPNNVRKAIILRNTEIRLLPTKEPLFNSFDLAGEGYPFDMLQNSSISVNTPVLIIHKSKDGAWYFVETPFCEGWIPEENLAFVDDSFIKTWENEKYRVITEENVPIYDEEGIFRVKANVGALFPEAEDNKILLAVEGNSKNAKIEKVKLSLDVSAKKPLKATGENISLLINKLIGEPYGWGGFLGYRDCSSTMKDIFTVFGIWLPRNSTEQAKTGIFISLKNLNKEEKEKMITDNGVPYMTLIWLKGHIMLYIGNENNKAIAFHTMWGVRIKDIYGKEGRKIVGASVITTLEPGKEIKESTTTILDKIEGITLLVPPFKIQNMLK